MGTSKDQASARRHRMRALLAERPHGIEAEDAARMDGCHASTARDILLNMVRAGEAVRVVWPRGRSRWAAPQHQQACEKAALADLMERRAEHERRLAEVQAPCSIALTDGQRMATVAYQPTVRAWPKVDKRPGPSSVWNLAEADA